MSKNNKTLLVVAGLLIGAIVTATIIARWQRPVDIATRISPPTSTASVEPSSTTYVPAHYETAPAANSLGPTLAPARFDGKTRQAYQAAKEIPQTIAQLPCYCYCDRGMGHKSLHSCFEDDHAAHCAVCTDEALMAYRLQKEGLNPKQIRERIIEQFSGQ